MTRVGIIDYGVGNLRSVSNALSHVGATPVISDDPDTLNTCERIIFPGVGAFAYGKKALFAKGLEKVVYQTVEKGKPMLAICVGMQLLFDLSREFGTHEGLGIIPGSIDRFRNKASGSEKFRLPNVNWLPIAPAEKVEGLGKKLLDEVTENSRFYFVHSYHAESANPFAIATSHYAGLAFAAAVGKGSVCATQFHPEKSGQDGLKMLSKFVN